MTHSFIPGKHSGLLLKILFFLTIWIGFGHVPQAAGQGCIKKSPTNPYPGGIDTICQGVSIGPQTNIFPDSAGFVLQWALDTVAGPVTSSPPKIDSSVIKTTVLYVRQFKNNVAPAVCFSKYQKLIYTVLAKPSKPSLKPKPPAPANRKISICEGFKANLNDSLVAPGAGQVYRWFAIDSTGKKVPFSGTVRKAKYTGRDTIYYVQRGGGGLCFGDTLAVNVAVLPLPSLKVNPQKGYTICEGLDIPFNVLDAHTGYKPTYDWYVNRTLIQKRGGPNFVIPKGGGFKAGDSVRVYYVVHIDKFAPYYLCDSVGPPFASDTVGIKVLPKSKVPGSIFGPYIVYEGQKNVFYKVPLDSTLVYSWRLSNPKDGLVKFANNTATVNYSDSLNFSAGKQIIDTLTVIVKNVCDSSKQSLVIYIRPYLRPINILTPNGDNINDSWIIKNIENDAYTANEVMVYDRFGTLVYKRQNYTNLGAWDGTFQGRPLAEGTYYYIITYKEDNFIKAVKGYVSILRGR